MYTYCKLAQTVACLRTTVKTAVVTRRVPDPTRTSPKRPWNAAPNKRLYLCICEDVKSNLHHINHVHLFYQLNGNNFGEQQVTTFWISSCSGLSVLSLISYLPRMETRSVQHSI